MGELDRRVLFCLSFELRDLLRVARIGGQRVARLSRECSRCTHLHQRLQLALPLPQLDRDLCEGKRG